MDHIEVDFTIHFTAIFRFPPFALNGLNAQCGTRTSGLQGDTFCMQISVNTSWPRSSSIEPMREAVVPTPDISRPGRMLQLNALVSYNPYTFTVKVSPNLHQNPIQIHLHQHYKQISRMNAVLLLGA